MAVPVGAAAGAVLRFRHASGAMYTVPVPAGVAPGRMFYATLPVEVPIVPRSRGASPGQVDVGATIEATLKRCCAACLAEVYCCCLPFYLLSLLLSPFFMAVSLGCAAVGGVCQAASAGCMPVGRLADDWWPSVLVILHGFDRTSSMIAFGDPSKLLLLSCALQTEALSEAVVVVGEPVDPADWTTPDVVLVDSADETPTGIPVQQGAPTKGRHGPTGPQMV